MGNTPSDGIPKRSSRAELHHDGTHWLLAPQASERVVKQPPGLVPALENAVAILQFLNDTPPHEAALVDLTAALDISKTHCHSILKTLVHFEWLKFDPRSKTYRLHSGLLSTASSLLNSPVLDAVRRSLSTLVQRVDIPCLLTQPMDDDTFIVIDKFNGPKSMEISFPIGHRFPRDACAQMRAYLGWQTPQRLDLWMQHWTPARYTSKTPLDAKAIRASVAATRERGYALSQGEFTEGIMAIALPIFDRDGQVSFIFNCSFMIDSFLPEEKEVAAEMIRAATEIHRATLARPPESFPAL